ncbi:MAG: peptidylprolyl isomerase, partial [Daejeonella sp.]
WVYNKSNGNPATFDEKSLKSYLDLYVNFRLKVLDAKAHGLDQEPGFKEELSGYRDKLASRYLLEREVSDKLINEAYARSQKIIKASHILILCAAQAPPADTLIAYNKIKDIRDQAAKGISFEELAAKYSEEPGAGDSKGNLGSFSVFQMVYPFETAAYNTPKGKISNIVRTTFGYHLIKVYDIFPNPGQIEIAHIMVTTSPQASYADSVLARNKAFEIYRRVKAGEDFASLATQYSDDKNSAKRGGKLEPIALGQTVKPFEQAAFALNKAGDISEPVKTDYGWHIIQLVQKVPLPPIEQVKNILKNRVNADERSALSQDAFVKRLKKEYHVKENENALKEKELQEMLNGTDNKPNATLFTLNSEPVLVAEFEKYIAERKANEQAVNFSAREWYQNFMNDKLIGMENNHLEDHYPDFKFLMEEYRNGILLYNYSERKIWDYSQTDTAGLKKFFDSHASNYQWKERAKASIYVAGSPEVLALTKKMLADHIADEEILIQINQSNPLNLVINKGIYERGEHMFLDRAVWKNNTDSEVNVGNAYALVKVENVIPAKPKNFDEVRGIVLTDYQSYLEKEWIKNLKQQYPVTVNKVELKKLIK